MTIVLQLQIDFAFGGWKIASALLRSLTRKTLPELWPAGVAAGCYALWRRVLYQKFRRAWDETICLFP